MSGDGISEQIASVLIVDDSRVQREHGVAVCREVGITHTYEASNGREALALLEALQPRPSLMIVDLEMPTMDGAELLEQMQRLGIDVPVVVASSRELALIESVQAMGHMIGVNVLGALQKPLRVDTLRASLNNVANVQRQKREVLLPIDADELREGLGRGEISVHYQPKVDLRTGIVRGVEALARWHHPTLGLVPPDQFIPLAERSDLIHPLTIEVLQQSMLQACSWQSRGLHLTIAINLSPLLLDRPQLPNEIESLRQSCDLQADQVTLELTESALVTKLGVALGVLARLRLKGFGLSIDDYGTGFASMQQLARVPFTELKIDRSFVHEAHRRDSLQVLLRSALDMANQLGLITVAEGVETLEDWRLLQEFGCTLAQGYLIAQPMTAADMVPWLKNYRARQAGFAQSPPSAAE